MPISYHAGKARLAKDIYKVIMKKVDENTKIQKYAEPFCGMLSVGLAVMKNDNKRFRKFLFSDSNERVTVFLKALQRGWLPKVEMINKTKWEHYKKTKDKVSAQKSFIGFTLGFSSAYFAGTQGAIKGFDNKRIQPKLERKIKQLKELKPLFTSNKFSIKEKSVFQQDYKNTIIYCDPPYFGRFRGQTKFGWSKEKDEAFWRKIHSWLAPEKNNIVLISKGYLPKRMKDIRVKTIFKKEMNNKQHDWLKYRKKDNRIEYLFQAFRREMTRKKKGKKKNKTRKAH